MQKRPSTIEMKAVFIKYDSGSYRIDAIMLDSVPRSRAKKMSDIQTTRHSYTVDFEGHLQ